MVLPPLLNFRLGPAFVLDLILRLEVNWKMTERLQVGNVLRAMISSRGMGSASDMDKRPIQKWNVESGKWFNHILTPTFYFW
jgi:hypothetical protein